MHDNKGTANSNSPSLEQLSQSKRKSKSVMGKEGHGFNSAHKISSHCHRAIATSKKSYCSQCTSLNCTHDCHNIEKVRSVKAMWKGIVNQSFSPISFKTYVDDIKMIAWKPRFVVLHNTASPTASEWHSISGTQRMLNLETYYRDQQKWSGGPHIFVADDLIWAFTPLTVPGVHSPAWNQLSWGVEMVGNFQVEPFIGGVKNNAVATLAILYKKLGADPNNLKLHREDPLTTHHCPGDCVKKDEMIQLVTEYMKAL